jgi:transcriptional regulator with XRE-family HTH domain
LSGASFNGDVKVIGTNQHAALVALIRAKRRAAGLRQDDVAKKLGETQQWVALIEAGQRRIGVIELIALANAIGFDPGKAVNKIAKIKN